MTIYLNKFYTKRYSHNFYANYKILYLEYLAIFQKYYPQMY